MDFIEKMVGQFLKLNRKMKRWQRAVSILGAVVVFASTYMLVLPAITLDKDTASTQAGIEVAASENDPSEDGTLHFYNAEVKIEDGAVTGISFRAPEAAVYFICFVLK